MLTNLLAWSMAIASLGLYLLGFFLPELYRRFDLIASGAGLFFALTLWIYGDRIGGGLLLGTTAAVALILWFGWQTLSYRWQLTYPGDRTDTQKAQALWQKIQSLLPAGTLAKIGEQLQSRIASLRDRSRSSPIAPSFLGIPHHRQWIPAISKKTCGQRKQRPPVPLLNNRPLPQDQHKLLNLNRHHPPLKRQLLAPPQPLQQIQRLIYLRSRCRNARLTHHSCSRGTCGTDPS